MKQLDYLKSRVNKMSAVFGLIYDEKGRLLIVKPSYKDGWMLVGGGIDKNEHPAESLKREFMEEVNLDVEVRDLKQVSSRIVEEDGEKFDLYTFLFEVRCDDISVLKIDDDEIVDFAWLEMEDEEMFNKLSRSWQKRLENLGSSIYLEF